MEEKRCFWLSERNERETNDVVFRVSWSSQSSLIIASTISSGIDIETFMAGGSRAQTTDLVVIDSVVAEPTRSIRLNTEI